MICFFLFYNKAAGKQARLAFNKNFLHCSVLVCNDKKYIHTTFGRDGITNELIFPKDWQQLARLYPACVEKLSSMIVVELTERHIKKWSPLWVKSCNEISRYVSGVNIGFTFNPWHLYAKLIKYNKRTNYKIIHEWKREPKPTIDKEVEDGAFWRWRRRC